jgi:hypothetical protein
MSANLKEISNFIKKNNNYSDFNLVNNFLLNLNYTKINFKKNLTGGNNQIPIETNNSEQFMPETINNNFDYQQNMEMMNEQSNMSNENLNNENLNNENFQITNDQYVQNTQQNLNNYLQNPIESTEQINTYTIKEGTILYHATSNKKGFDTKNLNLGNDKLINFFTPNFRLASDKIEGCSVDKQNGFIHVFKVIKDIPNIYVKLPYDIADDINSGILADEFCSKNQNYYGIGFFYPKNNIEMFSDNYNQQQTQYLTTDNIEQYYSEFGLCNPKPYLEYLYSQKCQSLRKLSDPYRFN